MIEWRPDGGRTTDPEPEHECRARCGNPVLRQHSLCRECTILWNDDRETFRARVKKRRKEGKFD